MALSNYLSRDEWIASYVLYLVHAVHFPEEFPFAVDLSYHLRMGLWILRKLGYQNWAGITWENDDLRKYRQVRSEGPLAFEEFLGAKIPLKDWWQHTMKWLEQIELSGEGAEHRSHVLAMLQERLPHIDSEARVGWAGFAEPESPAKD